MISIPLPLPMPGGPVYSVKELTFKVKQVLEGQPELKDVIVRGEVYNCRDHPSGHLYFTLKDDVSALRCVMFKSRREPVGGPSPQNGEMILAQGYVGLYERDGQYQLYVQRIWRDAETQLGHLYLALEALKARLKAEGLFDEARKRPLPLLPRRIGIVTSPTAAALRDMVRVIRRRYPNAHMVLVPALVQGDRAPADIARAITLANSRADWIDVLIVGRGGGAAEELWAFNSEEVARAIAASRIPVVSAVGHETDFTVADLVADLRAPTPSAAAELVVPEKALLERQVSVLTERLARAARQRLTREGQSLSRLLTRPALSRPRAVVDQRRQRLDDLQHRLALATRHALSGARAARDRAEARLLALDPKGVLSRGYSLCLTPDGRPVVRAGAVAVGEKVRVVLREGALGCGVEEVEAGTPPDGRFSNGTQERG